MLKRGLAFALALVMLLSVASAVEVPTGDGGTYQVSAWAQKDVAKALELGLLSDYDLTGDAPSAAGTLVLGYGSLKDDACASVGETLKKVCTAAREASVTV